MENETSREHVYNELSCIHKIPYHEEDELLMKILIFFHRCLPEDGTNYKFSRSNYIKKLYKYQICCLSNTELL